MKRCLILVFCIALLGVFLTGCLNTPSNDPVDNPPADAANDAENNDATIAPVGEPITLKLAHYNSTSHPSHLAALQFKEEVETNSGGSITVEIYPNNELGNATDQLQQCIMGTVDICLPNTSEFGRYSDKFYAMLLPYVLDSYEHAHAVYDGPFIEWAGDDLENENLVYLAMWEYGFRNVSNNGAPINSADDIAGIKIRIPSMSQLEYAFTALGCITEKIAFDELYLALRQGVVDGQENPIATFYNDGFYEVQQNLAITNHIYDTIMQVISKSTWDKMDADQQAIVKTAGANAGTLMRQLIQDTVDEQLAELEAAGITITYPDLDSFRAKMIEQDVYGSIAETCGQENVDYVLQFVDEYRP